MKAPPDIPNNILTLNRAKVLPGYLVNMSHDEAKISTILSGLEVVFKDPINPIGLEITGRAISLVMA